MEKLVATPRCNILTLTQVSSGVRTLPEVLEAAQVLTEDGFIGKLTREHNQCLERVQTAQTGTYPAGDMDQVKKYLRWVGRKR